VYIIASLSLFFLYLFILLYIFVFSNKRLNSRLIYLRSKNILYRNIYNIAAAADLREGLSSNNFIEWFRGFSDAEGNFYINIRSDTRASFRFEIHLHVDDTPLLHTIRKELGMGEVFTSGDKFTFVVSRLDEVRKIIAIFTKYPLNSTKLLNCLAFSKAFELYTTRSKESTSKVIEEIINLKNTMNSKRTEFIMPESYKPNITVY
jgi:hypothetical protein